MQHPLGTFQATVTFDRGPYYEGDNPRPLAHLNIHTGSEVIYLNIIEPDIVTMLMRAWERHVFGRGPAPAVQMTLQFTSEQDGEASE